MTLTVTSEADDLALLSSAELTAALGSSVTLTAAQLSSLNKKVAALIAQECNVARAGILPPTLRLESLSQTFRLKSGSRTEALVLARRPVVAITSVTEAGTLLTADQYEVDAPSAILRRLSGTSEVCWASGLITVIYDAGWEDVPEDLKQAAATLAVSLHAKSGSGGSYAPNLKRESVPGLGEREYWVSEADDPLIPNEVKEALTPYRNYVVG